MSTSNRLALCTLTFLLSACSAVGSHVAESATELSWAAVPLEGMRLELISPKSRGQSEILGFGRGGSLAVTVCSNQACTHPLSVWKIENNRLKTGYAPSEGDTLIGYETDRIVMREPDGRVLVYSIIAN